MRVIQINILDGFFFMYVLHVHTCLKIYIYIYVVNTMLD